MKIVESLTQVDGAVRYLLISAGRIYLWDIIGRYLLNRKGVGNSQVRLLVANLSAHI